MLGWLIPLLRYTAPIALAATGETIDQKSGVINIGIEGMMLCGAFFGMLGSLTFSNPWIGIVIGTLAGVGLAAIAAVFIVSLLMDQVVVGTAVNLFALGLTGTLFRARFRQAGQLLTVQRLPDWHGIDAVLVLLLLSVVAAWYLLNRTAWGLAMRSAGEYPQASEAAGFRVSMLRWQGLLIGGAFAGLAGAYLSLGITGSFAENMTAGRGFIAIAIVTFGRWKPVWVFLAALLIGIVESLQYRFQAYGWNLPFQLMLALPYIVALLVLVVVGKGGLAPAALGQPYKRGDA